MSEIPEGSIVITPTEVYHEVRSLTEVVRELVTQDKADRERDLETRKEVDALKVRVSSLEQKVWIAAGAAAAAGAGLSTWLPTAIGR